MTAEEKLIEIIETMPLYSPSIGASIMANIRAAGWLLIPPLDTEEGREAVEKMLSTWFDDESVEIISAAISAAGGPR